MYDPCACIPADVKCAIAGAATLTARPSVVYRGLTPQGRKKGKTNARVGVSRNVSARLKPSPSVKTRMSVKRSMRLTPSTPPEPVTQPLMRAVGLKARIACTSGPFGTLSYGLDSKGKIKAESTVTASLNVSMRLTFFEAIGTGAMGLSFACTTIQPDYGAYVIGTLKSTIPLELNLRVNTGVQALLTGPSGILTRIGPQRSRKLRWRVDEYKSGTPPTKKYVRRLVVSDRNGCGCQFVHLAIYELRSGIWEVGTERQVMLVLPQMSALGPYFPPDIYPQYTEDGNYRVVTVMNKMYDLYPPTSFVDIEIRGRKQLESPNSITELPRFVFVYEGCSGAFFLINAECE
jgi:hypothetical protein